MFEKMLSIKRPDSLMGVGAEAKEATKELSYLLCLILITTMIGVNRFSRTEKEQNR